MSEDVFYAQGLRFQCTRCSRCCRHTPGYVFLSSRDLEALCASTAMTASAFRAEYCRVVDLGIVTRLSLKEKPNFDCIFWENGGCTQYDARPFQCRSFPFWSAALGSRADWDLHARQCPGMNEGPVHPRSEIEALLERRIEDGFLEK
jgi:uncharacterized protein